MSTPRRLLICALLSLTASALTPAQTREAAPERAPAAAPTVTVSAVGARVRFTALGPVSRTRLEVFDAAGNQLFDSGFLPGNARVWSPAAGQGPAVADGSYQCVVTARDLSGRLSLRQGTVRVEGGEFSLQLGEAASDAEVEDAGADSALAPVGAGAGATAVTLSTHDGRDGSLTSTAGALTLRTGDILKGEDKEHVRVTEEGRVGIGTDKPEATLDVAGTIRARGLVLDKTGAGANTVDDPQPLVDGTGTTNQVTKWTNGPAGTLGDSAITEVGGRVGIGTTSPTYRLVVGPDIGSGFVFADLTVSKGAGQSVSAYVGPSGARGMEFGWNESAGRAFLNAPAGTPIAFTHNGTVERVRIEAGGNVGIGTAAAAAARLDVAGNINSSIQYDIGGARVLSVPGPVGIQNLFVGLGAGSSPVIGHSNVAVGNVAGAGLTNGHSNTFVGVEAGRSTDSGESNTFVGLSAGRNQTGGVNNSYFGREAGLNTNGSSNSFFGRGAGINQLSGNFNTYVGASSGLGFGTGTGNTVLGASASGAAGLTNATAIGYQSLVTSSDAVVLGRVAGPNNVPTGTNVGIGTTAPTARLHVATGDAAITTQGTGLVLRATDGPKCFRVTVNNAGTLSATEVPCP